MRRALLAALLAALLYIHVATGTSSAALGRGGPGLFQAVVLDHPIWNPSGAQVYEWVNDGINAAASNVALEDVPGVKRWVWGDPNGKPIGRGQSLRFVTVATPQFVATVAGWAAAQNEAIWARIQIDQEQVAAERTRAIAAHWRRRRGNLLVTVGIQGKPHPNDGYRPTVALYYDNAWRCLHDGNFSTLCGFTEVGRPSIGSSPLWATAHVVKAALDRSAFSDPDNTALALLELERLVVGPTNTAFDPRLPTPTMPIPGCIRVAVGDPDSLRHVDLSLNVE